jgi:AraC-like DNA-binding protein
MNVQVTGLLFVLIIFQLLLLSFFLFIQQKGKRVSNTLLGTFFLSICLNLADVFLLRQGIYFAHPALAGWGSCLPLLFGPLLYFFTQSVVYKDFSISLKSWLQFLPFVIFFLLTEIFYLRLPYEKQEKILTDLSLQHMAIAFSFVSVIIFMQFLFYAIASLRLIALYKNATNQLFSDPGQTNVSWLYSTNLFFILIMLAATLNTVLAQTNFARYYLLAFNLVVLAVLVFVIKILLKALQQPGYLSFTGQQDLPGFPVTETNTTVAENTEKEKIVQTAVAYMKSHKPYLEPELTLVQLAAQLSIKPRILSQAINSVLQQNFFDFINHYRIEEATRMLTNPEDKKITILEVLYGVGFNSKSSFNTLFKKYVGLTPTEFRKKQEP